MDADEGRIRRLQRTAYGADVTDGERERAVAELAELAEHSAVRDEAQGADLVERTAPDTSGRRRFVRWTIAAGAAGLLVGAALGWGVGQRLSVDSAAPSTAGGPESSRAGTPLEDTDLLALFDRLPPADESTRVASVDDTIDPASVRLLATRVDGPAAFLARTADGENVCLVLLLPAGPSRSECTLDGRLPPDGLRILYGAEGYGLSAAQLDPTGVVSLGFMY
ncbi:hypothetical protein ACFWN7_06550 [Agromyces sp. NPDC058484]|uniref:hypothetical protein n=1 Tax=Agromyces sp. NPDC058484 TaxID=3346524 RepID=UPI003669535F